MCPACQETFKGIRSAQILKLSTHRTFDMTYQDFPHKQLFYKSVERYCGGKQINRYLLGI